MLLNSIFVAFFAIGGARAFSPRGGGRGLKPARIRPPSAAAAASPPRATRAASDEDVPSPDAAAAAAASSRRSFLRRSASSVVAGSGAAALVSPARPARAAAAARPVTGASSGDLPELPPEAVRSYLQYRFGLQLAADFYAFDLQAMVADTDEYGAVNELVASKGARGGAGGASRIEREYVNPMRIIGLSMPPEYADDIRETQFAFERAMARMSKATSGIKRDLPVEIDKTAVPKAKEAWEDGRVALNSFFTILNAATGLKDELKVIPPPGPDQLKEYGRSIRRCVIGGGGACSLFGLIFLTPFVAPPLGCNCSICEKGTTSS